MTSPDSDSLQHAVRAVLEELDPSGGLEIALRDFDQIGRPSAILPLLRRLGASDRSPRIRYQAERFLKAIRAHKPAVQFGNPPDHARIAKGLQSRNTDVRFDAAKALRACPDEVAFPLLRDAITRPEPDHWVLASMVSLLGLKGGAAAAEVAAGLLDHESPRVQANSLLALFAADPEAGIAAARDRLDDPDPRMRASATMATFTADPDLAWSHVIEMLESPEVWMRTSGSYLAAKLTHEDSERALMEALLKEDDPALVIRTLTWLGRAGTADCIDTLELLARLGDPRYRAPAQASLEMVRDRAAKQAAPTREPAAAILESGFSLQDTLHGARSAQEVRALTEAARAAAEAASAAASGEGVVTDEDVAAGDPADPTPLRDSGVLREPARPGPDSPRAPTGAGAWDKPGARRGDGDAAPAPPEPPLTRPLRLALNVFCVLVVGATGHFLWSRSRPPPPPPVPGAPAAEPAAREARPVELRGRPDGRVDLRSQPPAGATGVWVGEVARASARELTLESGGVKAVFLFQEAVSPVPATGDTVRVRGRVLRKRARGITLLPGVEITPEVPGS